eukprot:scaffold83938_cov17-Tisochrysis_lutea.AAC.2
MQSLMQHQRGFDDASQLAGLCLTHAQGEAPLRQTECAAPPPCEFSRASARSESFDVNLAATCICSWSRPACIA